MFTHFRFCLHLHLEHVGFIFLAKFPAYNRTINGALSSLLVTHLRLKCSEVPA